MFESEWNIGGWRRVILFIVDFISVALIFVACINGRSPPGYCEVENKWTAVALIILSGLNFFVLTEQFEVEKYVGRGRRAQAAQGGAATSIEMS